MTFEEVYREHHDCVLRCVSKHFNHNVHLVEDLAQEVWISVFQNFNKYRVKDTQDFRGLLRRIAERRVADYFRLKGNSSDNKILSQTASANALPFLEYQSSPEVGFSDRVYQALNNLNKDMRECVLGVLVDGYTHKEMANKLGISQGTVLSRVSRGKSKLYKSLQ